MKEDITRLFLKQYITVGEGFKISYKVKWYFGITNRV